MAIDNPEIIVSTEWLERHLGDSDLRLLDGSWHLPPSPRNAQAEFAEAHILGAQFFDIDEIADSDTDLPHMAPGERAFEDWMRRFGIGNDSRVVVYDAIGLFSAPRVRWLLRHMGLRSVAVLDGGLPKWKAEGRATEAGPKSKVAVTEFNARKRPEMVSGKGDVKRACETGDAQILDARPSARFKGEAPEPRPGLRRGHMPGAINVPFASLLNPDQTLKDPRELRAVLDRAGFDFEGAAITSCGSGVAAAIVSLALELLGHRNNSLYDGSWAQWGMEGDTEVVAG